MHDPDLIGRAQRAATELEQSWDRWRAMHGISREPMPAVSSYVGYSLEEPWGEPRVVLGIEAREAEQFAALLDRHDCAGPVYAGLASVPGARLEQGAELIPAAGDRGRIVVPGQAQATVAEREAAWREATWRETTLREQQTTPREQQTTLREQETDLKAPESEPLAPLQPEPPGPDSQQPGKPSGPDGQQPGKPPAAAMAGAVGTSASDEVDAGQAQASGGAEPSLTAFRPQADPGSYPGEDDNEDTGDPAPAADEPGEQADEEAEASAASAMWSRSGRGRSHALPKQRRGGARGGAGKQARE